ncbi:KLTH0H04840p [Lachancea thermotolerans CBS 6340]|uniref:KLTH0H04840p n=1 Tax=Lachancea thermotolerans (strain ATCC 56472 / CBS 6340 / NRRL Y-8284) TaxID=559295 RepID=C5E2G8_LACTC|nr:KLTH0H04840p [Lachancea thermotolerans CBS 6340]CAR30229.1 KLTH0H04840p [Lachancea thermotolerans CBS 6340]
MCGRMESLWNFCLSLCLRIPMWIYNHCILPLICVLPFFQKYKTFNYSYHNRLVKEVVHANDILDIAMAHGFDVQEHLVRTQDGYLLTVHRVLGKKSEVYRSQAKKPVVYFHHGLLTNSELFLLGQTSDKCLPFLLVERGYDVWLGNNRGNKYSRKHINLSSRSAKFWDFSLDEYAIFDIPNTISYILNLTGLEKLTYIGFSQGSSQAFAAFSINPQLRDKIQLFVGLSPAMIPRSLSHPVAKFLVTCPPELLYFIFGTRAILPSVVFWQRLFGPINYMKIVDWSLVYLFNWKSEHISSAQKQVGYTHMFSPSSVKSVAHWFQIIHNKRFQMFQEDISKIYSSVPSLHRKLHRCAPFPVQVIENMPMMLLYGDQDILIDMETTKQNLVRNLSDLTLVELPGYEHMDTLWAENVVEEVFNPILKKIDQIHAEKPYQNGLEVTASA